MSVDSTIRRVVYACNGTTTTYAFHFKLFNASAAAVAIGEPTSPTETKLAYGVDYTVVLNADQEANPGGTVTLLTAPANGMNIAIISEEAYVQPMVLTPYDGFNPETLNDNADLQAIQIQQLKEMSDRHLSVPSTSDKSAEQVMADVLDTAAHAAEYADQAKETLNEAKEVKALVDGAYADVHEVKQAVDITANAVAEKADRLLEIDRDGALTRLASVVDSIGDVAGHIEDVHAVGQDLLGLNIDSVDLGLVTERADPINTGGSSLIGQVVDNIPSIEGVYNIRDEISHIIEMGVVDHPTMADVGTATHTVGRVVKTSGFYATGDGGGAQYIIEEAATDELSIAVGSQFARLIPTDSVINVRKLGAKGDGVADDSDVLQKAFDYAAKTGCTVLIPVGKYKVTRPISVTTLRNVKPRVKPFSVVGMGSQVYDDDDGSCQIIGYGIPAYRGVVEILGQGNAWSGQNVIRDIEIRHGSGCDAKAFCLFLGDTTKATVLNVVMNGNNCLMLRCGSAVNASGQAINNSYCNICTKFMSCGFVCNSNAGFTVFYESFHTGKGEGSDNIEYDNCYFYGGVAIISAKNVVIKNCSSCVFGKDTVTYTSGYLNGATINHNTPFLIDQLTSGTIMNCYFEDFKCAIDVMPNQNFMQCLRVVGCYFNAIGNSTNPDGSVSVADYAIHARKNNASTSTDWNKLIDIRNCTFRIVQRGSGGAQVHDFNVAAVHSDNCETIVLENCVQLGVNYKNSDISHTYSTSKNPYVEKDTTEYLPVAGGTIRGNLAVTGAFDFTGFNGILRKTTTSGRMMLFSGTDFGEGASVYLYGKDHATYPNQIQMYSGTRQFTLKPDGSFEWNGTTITLGDTTLTETKLKSMMAADDGIARLALTGGTMTGNIEFNAYSPLIKKISNTGRLCLFGGTDMGNGASVYLYGKDHATAPNELQMYAGTKAFKLKPGGDAEWGGSSITIGSTTLSEANLKKLLALI